MFRSSQIPDGSESLFVLETQNLSSSLPLYMRSFAQSRGVPLAYSMKGH